MNMHIGVDNTDVAKSVRSKQESMKLARTFFSLFLAFTICWMPFAFLTTIDFAGDMPDAVYIFVVLFAHGNSTVNFFLYGLTNNQFRAGYVRFLRLDRLCPSLKVKPFYNPSMTVKTNTVVKTIAVKAAPTSPQVKKTADSAT